MADKKIEERFTAEEAVARLNSIGAGVLLLDFRILKRHFEIVPRTDAPEAMVRTGQGLNVSVDQVRVSTEFSAILFPPLAEGAEAEAVAVSFSQSIGIAFQFPPETDPDSRMIFAKIGGVISTWPYWRTFLHSASSEAGLHPHFAPLILPRDAAAMAGFRPETPST